MEPNKVMGRPVCAGFGHGEQRRNPFGVEDILRAKTQGSSFLATLGFEAESLWDFPFEVLF